MTERSYSDAELVAFDDGEMPESEAAQLAAALAGDAELAARLSALSVDREVLRAGLARLLDQAPQAMPEICNPNPATAAPPPRTRKGARGLSLAAAFALAAFLGALGNRLLAPEPELTWQELAAAYHALYTTQTLAAVPAPTADGASGQLSRLSQASGLTIPAGLSDIPGLSFRRAQILGHDGAAIVQLAYLDHDGVPFALCLRAATTTDERPMQARGFAGVGGVSWQADGVEYVLLAKRPHHVLERIAGDLAGQT